MWTPTLRGEIQRRLLVNYRLDPEVARSHIPAPFRPQLHNGHAVAGICLIRLGAMRPAGLPGMVGVRSENAAHRFAVEWDDPAAGRRTGVYIPRRDTDSRLGVLLGGRAFPGEHHLARFDVSETEDDLHVAFSARDGSASVSVDATVAPDLGGSGLFDTVDEASRFFEQGALGYSATHTAGRFEGLRMHTSAWKVEPVRVTEATSSLFDDPQEFPRGTAVLDNGLLMRRLPVAWEPMQTLRQEPVPR
ncbi:DUF2071 domain-containing protein [Nocardioides sp. YIM 152588]|uniref:DUF2071 domain-containing protein n=1 Tax=Nocardioides sp. YIM 152588 TaxID=3158259 RepID=UPI0032E3E18B